MTEDRMVVKAEISAECIAGDDGRCYRTAERAFDSFREGLLRSLEAIRDGKFPKGTKVVLGYAIRRPEVNDD